MLARKCDESLKSHHCQGPLYRVTQNGKRRHLCMGAIKRFIREGDDIEIGENVPRKFKKEESDVYIMDPPWRREQIFKNKEKI